MQVTFDGFFHANSEFTRPLSYPFCIINLLTFQLSLLYLNLLQYFTKLASFAYIVLVLHFALGQVLIPADGLYILVQGSVYRSESYPKLLANMIFFLLSQSTNIIYYSCIFLILFSILFHFFSLLVPQFVYLSCILLFHYIFLPFS